MSIRHEIRNLPPPLVAEASGDELRVSLPEGPSAAFLLIQVSSLTQRTAVDVLARADEALQRRIFVSYGRASAEARDALRAAGISFAGDDGRVFLRAPGILVERDEPARPRPAERWQLEANEANAVRNPFATRSSRIPRWLLLHRAESFSPSELAGATGLNPAATSRVVRALEEAALVQSAKSEDARRRSVYVKRPRALLDVWLPLWQRRRIRVLHWDIGAQDVEEAINLVSDAMDDRTHDWAIGGLAGAAMIRRAVDPVDLLVWTTPDVMTALADTLQPQPARGGRGVLHVAAAPDPWILGLTRSIGGRPIADPVQLWLDCSSEGERALEAADAVAEAAGWS